MAFATNKGKKGPYSVYSLWNEHESEKEDQSKAKICLTVDTNINLFFNEENSKITSKVKKGIETSETIIVLCLYALVVIISECVNGSRFHDIMKRIIFTTRNVFEDVMITYMMLRSANIRNYVITKIKNWINEQKLIYPTLAKFMENKV